MAKDSKKAIAICVGEGCGKNTEIYAFGRCQACYMKYYRAKKQGKEIAPLDDKGMIPDEDGYEDDLDDWEPEEPVEGKDDPAEFRLPVHLAPLTQSEADDMINRVASGERPMEPGLDMPPDATKGYRMMRTYLNKFGYMFRREIIRQMMSLGLTELQIMAAFMTEERLRARWVDGVQNPLVMFRRDFAWLKKENRRRRTQVGGLQAYIERLEINLRLANGLARDTKATANIRSTALQTANKIARDIAVLQRAIRPMPGQGDLPIGSSPYDADDGEDEDDEEGYEEDADVDDGGGIPEIETEYDE